MSQDNKEFSKMNVNKCYTGNLKGKSSRKDTDKVKGIRMNMREKDKEKGNMKRNNNRYLFYNHKKILVEGHMMQIFNQALTEEQQKQTMTLTIIDNNKL